MVSLAAVEIARLYRRDASTIWSAAAAFQQVLYLPAMYTETAPVGGQMARLKEFESIREFFSGPLAESLLDLPFLFLFLGVIGIIGGPLVLVPVCVAVMFVLLHIVLCSDTAADGAEVEPYPLGSPTVSSRNAGQCAYHQVSRRRAAVARPLSPFLRRGRGG